MHDVYVYNSGVLNVHVLIVEYCVGLEKQRIIPFQGMCIYICNLRQ
jgi:hypothetical protein